MRAAGYEEVFAAAERLLGQRPYIVIAVDGRCGSGKTQLAKLLAQRFKGRIVHTDDFYLPFETRRPGWEKIAGANMDFERLHREVVLPAAQGKAIRYLPYRCHGAQATQKYCDGKAGAQAAQRSSYGMQDSAQAEAIVLPEAPLTIVEGSYSMHPLLAGCYDLKIFLTCPAKVQRARLQEREGEKFAAFEARWIPLEEQYFRECHVRENCDLQVDTGSIF
ncbi:MAG: uridine kinase [Lachnospiraceae bacterium]|nr:uridine kinase [Lachnospiraceae bacterium]